MEGLELRNAVRRKVMEALNGAPGADERVYQILKPELIGAANSGEPKSPAAAAAVGDVVRGAMEGHLLQNMNLADASVRVMTAVVDTASGAGLDPEFMMRSALVGVAQAGSMGPAGTQERILGALDSKFMGIGSIYSAVCHAQAAAKPSPAFRTK